MIAKQSNEKIVILVTHGPEEPERATLPFVMANGALVIDTDVVVILQGMGVHLATKEGCDRIFAAGLPDLRELVDSFLEQGGRLLVSLSCMRERNISREMLVEQAEPISAELAIQEVLEASAVLNY